MIAGSGLACAAMSALLGNLPVAAQAMYLLHDCALVQVWNSALAGWGLQHIVTAEIKAAAFTLAP